MENLDQALASLINKTVSGVEQATEFLLSEIPVVIQQLLLWHFVKNLIFFIFGLVLFFAATYGAYWIYKKWDKGGRDWDGVELFMVLYVFAYVPPLCLVNIEWLQIWLAPKVWLIEYAAQLIK